MAYEGTMEYNGLGAAKYMIVAGALLGCVGWGVNFYERLSQSNLKSYLPTSVACASEGKSESLLENKVASVSAPSLSSAVASLDKKIH